jgi:hypothetical protein
MPRLMLPDAHVIWALGPAARELPVTDVAGRKYFSGLNKNHLSAGGRMRAPGFVPVKGLARCGFSA